MFRINNNDNMTLDLIMTSDNGLINYFIQTQKLIKQNQ